MLVERSLIYEFFGHEDLGRFRVDVIGEQAFWNPSNFVGIIAVEKYSKQPPFSGLRCVDELPQKYVEDYSIPGHFEVVVRHVGEYAVNEHSAAEPIGDAPLAIPRDKQDSYGGLHIREDELVLDAS